MRKFLSLILLLLINFSVAKSQILQDSFTVGPYDVDYLGDGKVVYRLQRGVDLFEYYHLKKDTIASIPETPAITSKNRVQVSLFETACISRCPRFSMTYGIEGIWKYALNDNFFLNSGLSFGCNSVTTTNLKQEVGEFGIPISIEWCQDNQKKAAFYSSIGVTPGYYLTMSAKNTNTQSPVNAEKYNGIIVVPRVDIGSYIKVGSNKFIRAGITCSYKINCSTKDYDVYNKINGNLFLGINAGIVL